MGVEASRYNVFGVEDHGVASDDILDRYGVYVVDEYTLSQLKPSTCQVAAVVSDNDLVSEVKPLTGMVEYLIQISIMSKCIGSNSTANFEIPVTLNERWNLD